MVRGTIYDNISGPAGPIMSNINGLPGPLMAGPFISLAAQTAFFFYIGSGPNVKEKKQSGLRD